jgi:bloom syndrome protein
VHLKRQVELLGEYLARSTQDEDRLRSHSMASTTAIQGHQPPMTPRSTFVMDADRFQSQVYIRNGPGANDLCYSSVPYSYMDNLNTPVNSVRREYTPRIIDINYTEGSNDKNWSSRKFPWTKDLEVMFFENHYLLTSSFVL